MVRMDEINKIRKEYFTQGKSRNELAIKYNRSWNTIDTIVTLDRDELKNRGRRPNAKKRVSNAEVVLAVENLIKQEKALKVRKKQRYTAAFIYKELKRNGIYQGCERSMREIVSSVRKQLHMDKKASYLPLYFEPGTTLQVDHGEFDAVISDQRRNNYLFVATIPGLSIRCCQAYPIKSREAWGAFHEYAFDFFGGVFSHVVYDNDSVLVKKILGTERKQTDFSLGLEEHYGFESIFCNPGAGNEKGSVENSVGYCRKSYLAGLPQYESYSEMNGFLTNNCLEKIASANHYRTEVPLRELLIDAQKRLLPLAPKREWRRWESGMVTPYQTVAYDTHWYSVPEVYIGQSVQIAVGIFTVEIYHENHLVASHKREYEKGKDVLLLDHYLDQLLKKPGALWNCKAVCQSTFESDLIALWNRLYSRMDIRSANKEFIKILRLKRSSNKEDYMTAIGLSLSYGSVQYDAVLNLLNQLQKDPPPPYDATWLNNRHPDLCLSLDLPFELNAYADLHKEVKND